MMRHRRRKCQQSAVSNPKTAPQLVNMLMRITILLLLVTCVSAMADSAPNKRMLFTFNSPDAVRQWQAVNDDVMGGRSDGRFRINEYKNLEFFGNLSLANNGGFASIRSLGTPLGLTNGDTITIRVRGDGREYTLNLYTSARRTAFSYRATFQTTKDEWINVTVPLSKFVATSFGRLVQNAPLNPAQVSGIGLLLGDKKAGAFKVELESIAVTSPLK